MAWQKPRQKPGHSLSGAGTGHTRRRAHACGRKRWNVLDDWNESESTAVPQPAVDMRTLKVQQLDSNLRARRSVTAANKSRTGQPHVTCSLHTALVAGQGRGPLLRHQQKQQWQEAEARQEVIVLVFILAPEIYLFTLIAWLPAFSSQRGCWLPIWEFRVNPRHHIYIFSKWIYRLYIYLQAVQ